MTFGLTEETVQQIRSVIEKYSVKSILIFGSRAVGNYKNNSDIDIALCGDLEALTVSTIKSELNELSTPFKFDVVHYDSIDNPNLKDHIDRVGKKL